MLGSKEKWTRCPARVAEVKRKLCASAASKLARLRCSISTPSPEPVLPEGKILPLRRQRVVQRGTAVDRAVLSGHNARTARRTDGVVAEGVFHHDALSSEFIYIWVGNATITISSSKIIDSFKIN